MSEKSPPFKATAAVMGAAAMSMSNPTYSYASSNQYTLRNTQSNTADGKIMNPAYVQIMDAKIGEAVAKVEAKIATTDSKFDRIMDKLSSLENVPNDISELQSQIGSKWVTFIAQALATVIAVGTFLVLLLNGIQFGQMLTATTSPVAAPIAEPLVIEAKPNQPAETPN